MQPVHIFLSPCPLAAILLFNEGCHLLVHESRIRRMTSAASYMAVDGFNDDELVTLLVHIAVLDFRVFRLSGLLISNG